MASSSIDTIGAPTAPRFPHLPTTSTPTGWRRGRLPLRRAVLNCPRVPSTPSGPPRALHSPPPPLLPSPALHRGSSPPHLLHSFSLHLSSPSSSDALPPSTLSIPHHPPPLLPSPFTFLPPPSITRPQSSASFAAAWPTTSTSSSWCLLFAIYPRFILGAYLEGECPVGLATGAPLFRCPFRALGVAGFLVTLSRYRCRWSRLMVSLRVCAAVLYRSG